MTTEQAQAYVSSRTFGDATVSIISEGTLCWAPDLQAPEEEWRREIPEAGADGKLSLGMNIAHVALPGVSVVIDPGLDDPDSAWQRRFEAESPGGSRSPGMAAALSGLGVAPEEVATVLITHAHGDHFCGVARDQDGELVARFPNARHLIGRADWEDHPDRRDPESDLSVRLGLIERLGLLELVDEEREVAPGLSIIPAPGESPGHSVVRLRSGGDTFYYVGDLFHHAAEVAHLDWVSPGRDRDAMRASRERLIAEAVPANAPIVFTHEQFPGWGRIVAADGGYRWARDEG